MAALLEVEGVSKRFPGVAALTGVHLRVGRGEVHALLGENGAGKSTLLKILSGAQHPDEGALRFDGRALDPRDSPHVRQRAGLATIYQEFILLPEMSVAENMFLGREPLRGGLVDWRRLYAQAEQVLEELGLQIDPKTRVGGLSVGEQQMIEVARALSLDAKLIIMDEPTAALSAREVDTLHEVVRSLRDRDISVIYVTHRLSEVKAICDQYTVLRDGRFVAEGDVAEVEIEDLVRLMVGRELEPVGRDKGSGRGPVALKISGVARSPRGGDLHATRLRNLSLEAYAGEVLGLAGLVGAGRTELARIIFGADGCDSGALWMDGRDRALMRSPAEALEHGVALVPEDRKRDGCFLDHSVRWNLSLPSLARLSWAGAIIDDRAERALFERYRSQLQIKVASDAVPIRTLSGGNQQKVLLARCLALGPKVLIVDEPTRGIDIGAKGEVHRLLRAVAAEGMAVVMISSELPELLAVADRIVTFREGEITGEFMAAQATEEAVMQRMTMAASAQGVS